jgi:hypothetical protein
MNNQDIIDVMDMVNVKFFEACYANFFSTSKRTINDDVVSDYASEHDKYALKKLASGWASSINARLSSSSVFTADNANNAARIFCFRLRNNYGIWADDYDLSILENALLEEFGIQASESI